MKRILSALLLLSCLLALSACGTQQETQARTGGAALLTAAVYPAMAPKPNQADYLEPDESSPDRDYFRDLSVWQTDLAALRDRAVDPEGRLDPWLAACMRQFLADAGDENRIVSPLNITMAMAMLAEVTDGETRGQLLELLGCGDLDTLRGTAAALWLQSYQDDGETRCVLANSLWMSQDQEYREEALENLAVWYYSSSFQGEMGSPAYDALLHSWIDEQTGGLLSGPAGRLHMEPDTVLALVSTVSFKAPWSSAFPAGETSPGSFSAPGGEVQIPFMHRSAKTAYCWGRRFAAVGQPMENGGAMWFLLPEEGSSPAALLDDPEAMDFLLTRSKDAWENRRELTVRLCVPKFDVSSDLDLIPGLEALGVRDVFVPGAADFRPLVPDADGLSVTQASHAARVLIDEEGCEAAAFTVVMIPRATSFDPPGEEIDFVLDRPFLFVITNAGGLPLFVGVVNRPAE